MFEGIRTAFKVLSAGLTINSTCIVCIVLLALLVVWCTISLLINNHISLKKRCISVINFVQNNGVNRENYSKLTTLLSSFPTAIRFKWKKFENEKRGRASDYLGQNECIDLQVNGGISRQCRSLMRSAILVCACMVALFSFTLIGATVLDGASSVELTNTLVADALILPLLFYILCMVVYYVYTSLRHLQHRILVDTFYDFLDVLDEKVDMEDLFGLDSNAVSLVSNVYTNETVQTILDKKKRARKREVVAKEVRVGSQAGLNNLNSGILGQSDIEDKTNENVVKSYEKMSTKLEPKSQTAKESKKIKNEAEFVEVIGEVEELVDTIGKEKNKEKRTELERSVNSKIKALTDYKQKAKSQKEAVTIKKSTKTNNK